MNEQEQQIRIAIVDDHEMFRAGVIATLQPHFDIVGQSSDVEGSVAMIAQTKPDVVLLDVHVPGGEGGGGAEILMKSRAYSPNTVFLALSVSDSPQDVGSVIRAGAQGYVTKTISGDDLISSIKQVHEGYAVFSPKLAGFVLSAFQNGSPAGMGGSASGPIHDDELDRLSNREQEVMRLIARGYTYKEVAAELFISIKTVETHVSSVLRKLQLSNRTELTRLGRRPPHRITEESSGLFRHILRRRCGQAYIAGMMHGESHAISDIHVSGTLERASIRRIGDPVNAHQRSSRLDLQQLVLLLVADHRFQCFVDIARIHAIITFEHGVERGRQIACKEQRKQICRQMRPFQRKRPIFDIPQSRNVVDHRMLARQSQQTHVGNGSRGNHRLQYFRRNAHALSSRDRRQ